MVLKKSVRKRRRFAGCNRIVKKICEDGVWKFVSLKQVQGRYQWDQRPGQYFLDWLRGLSSARTPSESK